MDVRYTLPASGVYEALLSLYDTYPVLVVLNLVLAKVFPFWFS